MCDDERYDQCPSGFWTQSHGKKEANDLAVYLVVFLPIFDFTKDLGRQPPLPE